MLDRTDWGESSDAMRPTTSGEHPSDRNRRRLRGWVIAVAASALLWALLVVGAWAMVDAFI